MTTETTEAGTLSVTERIFWGGWVSTITFGAAAVASRAIADTTGPAWWADVATWLSAPAFASALAALSVSTVTALLRRKRGSDVQ